MQKDDTAVSSMKNIILIGMPGCGKSTAGVLLAKTLGYSFLDTVLGEAAMARLGKIGKIVYLQLPLSQIQQRISNIKTRGIAMGPGEGLEDVYNHRAPLYERYADITVSAAFSLEETVEDIVRSVM